MTREDQLKTRADSALASTWAMVQERQEVYYNETLYRDVPTYDEDGNPTGTEQVPYKREQYWQGLATHGNLPHHDDADRDTTPDRLSNKPTDVAEDWDDIFPEAAQNLPFSLTIDTYTSPEYHAVQVGTVTDEDPESPTYGQELPVYEYRNQGYVLKADLMYKGTHMRRALNYGPEEQREQDWVVIEEPGREPVSDPGRVRG